MHKTVTSLPAIRLASRSLPFSRPDLMAYDALPFSPQVFCMCVYVWFLVYTLCYKTRREKTLSTYHDTDSSIFFFLLR